MLYTDLAADILQSNTNIHTTLMETCGVYNSANNYKQQFIQAVMCTLLVDTTNHNYDSLLIEDTLSFHDTQIDTINQPRDDIFDLYYCTINPTSNSIDITDAFDDLIYNLSIMDLLKEQASTQVDIPQIEQFLKQRNILEPNDMLLVQDVAVLSNTIH